MDYDQLYPQISGMSIQPYFPFTCPITNFLFIIIVEMDNTPSELHYRGDDQGTLAIVANG